MTSMPAGAVVNDRSVPPALKRYLRDEEPRLVRPKRLFYPLLSEPGRGHLANPLGRLRRGPPHPPRPPEKLANPAPRSPAIPPPPPPGRRTPPPRPRPCPP